MKWARMDEPCFHRGGRGETAVHYRGDTAEEGVDPVSAGWAPLRESSVRAAVRSCRYVGPSSEGGDRTWAA